MKTIIIPYKPHIHQKQLHADTHRFKTIVCGRRFGKTIFAINDLLKPALLNKNHNYWYIAPTYSQAKLIAWEKLKFYLPQQLVKKVHESDLIVKFKNGSVIRLMGADNPDRLRGVGVNGMILDEFADFKRNVWEAVLRPTLSDTQGWATFLGTPKGKMNHLYEMFIKDKQYHDKNYINIFGEHIDASDDFKSFVFRTEDNPYIAKEEIVSAKKEMSPQYYRQEYEASFENYTGRIYKEFETNKHIINEFNLKDWYRIFVGIDTGRHTAISFVAMDDKGRAYVFDEIYEYDALVSNIATMIEQTLLKWKIARNRVMFIIDSASQMKREYEQNRIYAVDSEKDVENQINQVRNRFASDGLFFMDTCKMHIIEHAGYVWDDKSNKVQPLKENDHTCNSLQYIFSTYNAKASVDILEIDKYKQSLEWATIHDNKNKWSKWS